MPQYKNHSEKLNLINNGKLSLVENVKHFLELIDQNKNINAYNFLFKEAALKQANEIEGKIKAGKPGKLAGMVIAIKDVLSIKDKPLTCSSKILKNFIALYDSTAVKNLIKEDAIIIGKTNCDEFAMGSSNENSAFGKVLNPVNKNHVPGGSSGGSAAAVAANLCDVSIGTDTGGSIRQPAAFCGIIGLKPTYGRVSRYGLTAFASSFDSIGPFARDIEDAAKVLEVISGKDKNDSTSRDADASDLGNDSVSRDKLKIGIPKEYFAEGLNSEINNAIQIIIDLLRNEGFEILDIALPHTEYSIATYYILTTAEASSNLARYDGARYGHRTSEKGDLLSMYTNSRTEGFGKEVKRRIMLGTYVLSSGYYEAYYKKAQKVRRLIKSDFDKAFKSVDVILSATTPTTAFKFNENISNPLQMYLNDIYTTSANLAGIPAISIPIGNDSNGLPIGMQLMADQFNESTLIKLSKILLELNL